MSHVLVCREKHGDFYYAASTDEELAVRAQDPGEEREHAAERGHPGRATVQGEASENHPGVQSCTIQATTDGGTMDDFLDDLPEGWG